MDISLLLSEIFEVCIIPLLGVLTAYFIKWINIQSSNLKNDTENELYRKYINMLDDTISNCVIATTQTYVESLKKQGKFDLEAQQIAFNKTFDSIQQLLTIEAKEYLNVAIGDLNLYITQKIESEVKLNKFY